LLRNVLIYFRPGAPAQAVLDQARHSMAPHARLILGESESIGGLDTAYRYERPMVYRTMDNQKTS
jgi:chemotaxis protein methyltransferase CheR